MNKHTSPIHLLRVVFSLILVMSISVDIGAQNTQRSSLEKVIRSLKEGGFILFMRHPQTNHDQADTDPLNLSNITNQRQLTDEGRQTAIQMGKAFKSLKIPFGTIISSRFNRAQETAQLLNLGEVKTSLEVTEGGLVVSPFENARRATALKKVLSTPPSKGTNILIISHKQNLQDAAGKEFADLEEGEVVVFYPDGQGSFKAIARVNDPRLWDRNVR
ncbi:MAG TPA: histidine phosphatase family protein [Oligoflexia bacterium]|nr:histidine phosphatase family protein [Oligoflexia bacterium]HMP48423.1 histidine phosphatase family protein [Oligoflexia bacterium]